MPQSSPANGHVEANLTAEVLKVDVAKRHVAGWASVIKVNGVPVVDSQGDVIEEDELLRAAHDFMKNARHAKVMHNGEAVGVVVDSYVWTEERQKAYGVDFGKVGWAINMELAPDVVERVERGELKMFSVGGSGMREEMVDGD